MKIALITYSRTKNYGGILQAYALYKYLADCGHDVSFVDYIPPRSNVFNRKEFVRIATRKSRLWGRNGFSRSLWAAIRFPKIQRDYQVFFDFLEGRAKFTRRYFSYEELTADPPQADLYLSGSDQIWNPQFAEDKKPELPFFLGFAKGRKISYASSFGVPDISDEAKEMITPHLRDYAHISVREPSGQKLLAGMGIQSEVVLDPTLICAKTVWDQMSGHRVIDKPYAILYQVVFNRQIYDMAVKLCAERGLKLWMVTMNRRDAYFENRNVIMTPSVQDWLSLLRYADLIITESFHATVFSILFQKNFVVNSATRKGMSSRITNLLSLLDISERELTDFDCDHAGKVIDTPVDWNRVNALLAAEQTRSKAWLADAINSLEETDSDLL